MSALYALIKRNKVVSLKTTQSDQVAKIYQKHGYVRICDVSGSRYGSVSVNPASNIKWGNAKIDLEARNARYAEQRKAS